MTARLLLTALSGWTLVGLLALTIQLPYRLRRRPAAAAAPPAGGRPAPWARLRLHFWFGYAIAGLALVHTGISMSRQIVGRAHHAGLRIASLALLLALVEVLLGLWLRRRTDPAARVTVRRIHFWAMAALAVLVVAHVALDSALLGTFQASH